MNFKAIDQDSKVIKEDSEMARQTNSEPKTVGTKVTSREAREINNLIEAGVYLSVSDFVRDAIRDKLKEIKVIHLRDVDYDTAKREVLGYYKRYSEAFVSDVAEDLELDLELVFLISDELQAEGRLGEVK